MKRTIKYIAKDEIGTVMEVTVKVNIPTKGRSYFARKPEAIVSSVENDVIDTLRKHYDYADIKQR